MVKKLKKKQRQLEDPLHKVIVESDHGSDSERSDICIHDTGFGSPQRDSLVMSTFKETGGPGANVHVSNTDTNSSLSDPPSTSIPDKAIVIPSEVS
ncbi:unnamed protein product [Lactuca virosa]|uniref:Uncharacterized protein n=1 Tax=Lactuca virosa TaxID=75947 RepID=A0AAU9MKM0_9ASTR|nr:unnamed protein product [Lactuca virosa]